jgi:hypothetical protein
MRNRYFLAEFIYARLIVYAISVLLGIYAIFIDSSMYLCSLEGHGCPMCGMRAATRYLVALSLGRSHASNPYIWALLAIVLLIFIDSLIMIKGLRASRKGDAEKLARMSRLHGGD